VEETPVPVSNAVQPVVPTSHSQARMQQRGISQRMIQLALTYGERAWSHGARCYRLTERSLRRSPVARECDRLRGLCVVVAPDGAILTVKWDYQLREPGPLRRANAANWSRRRSSPLVLGCARTAPGGREVR